MSDLRPSAPPWPEPFGNAEAFLEALVASDAGYLSYIDADERVVFASSRVAEWFGLTPGEMRGRTLRELHGEEGYARFEPWVRRAFSGEAVQYERAARHASGR